MPRRPEPDLALVRQRLANQRLTAPLRASATDLVRRLGAVQAQDFAGSLWAVGLRLHDGVEADVDAAIAARQIVRTWPLRGTLHLVPAEDVHWMLRLLTPRVLARSAGRYRQLGLGAEDVARARRVLGRALRGGNLLTRPAAYAELERGGVSPAGQRGIHLLGHLAQQGLLCCGPREGRQQTFVLLDEWVPAARDLPRDEALATLAGRYFASHGPATLQDFAWWSGLLVADARRAIAAAGLERAERGGAERWRSPAEAWPATRRGPVAALLPPWDEYVVAYRDRAAVVGDHGDRDGRAQLVGRPLVLVDGFVRGAWRRDLAASTARLSLDPWTPLSAPERRAVERAAERYGRFLGRAVAVRGLDGAG
jgi:hypothetical protein